MSVGSFAPLPSINNHKLYISTLKDNYFNQLLPYVHPYHDFNKKLSHACKMSNFMVKGFKKLNLIKKNLEQNKEMECVSEGILFMTTFY